MDNGLTERLAACYTGIIFDVMREMGHTRCVLPNDIRALDETKVLAGPIFTVRGRMEDNLSGHETLLRWTEFLSAAPAGHVVVTRSNDLSRAMMGELSAETLTFRGVRGFLSDGACRDTGFILKIGFPVFCSGRTPRDVVGAWIPEAFNEPITIGDVIVRPGDYILGDRDGALIIPADIIEHVVDRAETLIKTENLVRKAILEGEDPKQAYLRYGKF